MFRRFVGLIKRFALEGKTIPEVKLTPAPPIEEREAGYRTNAFQGCVDNILEAAVRQQEAESRLAREREEERRKQERLWREQRDAADRKEQAAMYRRHDLQMAGRKRILVDPTKEGGQKP